MGLFSLTLVGAGTTTFDTCTPPRCDFSFCLFKSQLAISREKEGMVCEWGGEW